MAAAPAAPPASAAADPPAAIAGPSASHHGEESFPSKLGRIKEQFHLDASMPIRASIEEANALMGLPNEGTLPQQVDAVLRSIGQL